MLMTLCVSQAECDELAQRADALKDENASLKAEVSRIRSDYKQLLAENASLKVNTQFPFTQFFSTFLLASKAFFDGKSSILRWTSNER